MGAGGGLAGGLWAFLGASLVSGFDFVMKNSGFEESLGKADLVVTGEGCMDQQTLYGKGPLKVAEKAKEKQIPVMAVVGKTGEGIEQLLSLGIHRIYPISTPRHSGDWNSLVSVSKQMMHSWMEQDSILGK